MRVLIIDNTIDPDSWGSAEIRKYAQLTPGATFYTRRAPHEDLPRSLEGFDKVIVSGSKTSVLEDAPWIDKLEDLIRSIVSSGKPYLGICYGHQTLVRALGGKQRVRLAQEPEFGWTRIELTSNGAPGAQPSLFTGLAPVFYSYSSHFDEVGELPPGFEKLARSKDCEIQACQIRNKPVYGIQFHPERSLADGEKALFNRKKLGVPKKLLNANQGHKLFDSAVGETIFKNFLTL